MLSLLTQECICHEPAVNLIFLMQTFSDTVSSAVMFVLKHNFVPKQLIYQEIIGAECKFHVCLYAISPQETLGEFKMCTQLNAVVKEQTKPTCTSQISPIFHMSPRHLFTSEVTTFSLHSVNLFHYLAIIYKLRTFLCSLLQKNFRYF